MLAGPWLGCCLVAVCGRFVGKWKVGPKTETISPDRVHIQNIVFDNAAPLQQRSRDNKDYVKSGQNQQDALNGTDASPHSNQTIASSADDDLLKTYRHPRTLREVQVAFRAVMPVFGCRCVATPLGRVADQRRHQLGGQQQLEQ